MPARIHHFTQPAPAGGLNWCQHGLVPIILASVTAAVLFPETTIRSAVGRDLTQLERIFGALFLIAYLVRIWSSDASAGRAASSGPARDAQLPDRFQASTPSLKASSAGAPTELPDIDGNSLPMQRSPEPD